HYSSHSSQSSSSSLSSSSTSPKSDATAPVIPPSHRNSPPTHPSKLLAPFLKCITPQAGHCIELYYYLTSYGLNLLNIRRPSTSATTSSVSSAVPDILHTPPSTLG